MRRSSSTAARPRSWTTRSAVVGGVGVVGERLRRGARLDEDLGQGVRDGVVELGGDPRALGEHGEPLVLVALAPQVLGDGREALRRVAVAADERGRRATALPGGRCRRARRSSPVPATDRRGDRQRGDQQQALERAAALAGGRRGGRTRAAARRTAGWGRARPPPPTIRRSPRRRRRPRRAAPTRTHASGTATASDSGMAAAVGASVPRSASSSADGGGEDGGERRVRDAADASSCSSLSRA